MVDPFFLPRNLPFVRPPTPTAEWAVFLDLDGTLLDIAATPDRVVVPVDLVRDIAGAYAALDGALAVVSGRTLGDIDRLLAPLRLPAGGEHGAVIRLPAGDRDEVNVRVPAEWMDALENAAKSEPGVLIERKNHTVVAHYRCAPRSEDFCRRLCSALVDGHESEFELLQGHMAIEIRPRGVTKARPVERLMTEPPFQGRRPIFVGDDATDEDGFRAAQQLGGEGLDVQLRFGGSPAGVRRWLKGMFPGQ
jgi:trehalose 6-phosphate phosphatase